MNFKIKSDWPPAGDQPKAIKKIVAGYKKGLKHQIGRAHV